MATGITKYTNLQDYRNRALNKGKANPLDLSTPKKEVPKEEVKEAKPEEVKDKVDISEEAKNKKVEDQGSPKSSSAPSAPKIGEAIGEVAKKASKLATNIPKPLPDLSFKEVEKLASKEKVEPKLAKPAIIFVSGMKIPFLFDSSAIEKMGKFYEGSHHFKWGEEDKIMAEILKRRHTEPVVLVGHSLGGDTAMNVANRLNTLEHGYRRINLLVTLDSIGLDNDIVPQNVLKNVNMIGSKNSLLNDAPNIAKNTEITEVVNELRPEEHKDLDDSPDIQFKIFNEINAIIK